MKGLVVSFIVIILGLSVVGSGQLSGSESGDHNSWWKNGWDYKGGDWYKSFSKYFDYKKLVGWMSSGGSGDDDDDDDGTDDNVDQSPIDNARVSFNIVPREVDDEGDRYFQNVVDECIFSSTQSFEPLCVKCKIRDSDGNIIGKGQIIDTTKSYVSNTKIPIKLTSEPPVDPEKPAYNLVNEFSNVEVSVCGFNCVPAFLDFYDLAHGAQRNAINTALDSQGITVSGKGNNGIDEVIIFDATKTGTADPDLQVGHGLHLLILPEIGTFKDVSPADGYIDSPNDAAAGGTIIITMTTPKFLKSFVLVDHENDHPADKAIAYSDLAGLHTVKEVKLPKMADGTYTTVTMNAANVKRLDVTYADSGGITNIDLKCNPPEQNCSCEKPDKFVVKYAGPSFKEVIISKNGKDPVTLKGPFPNDEITVDAIALGFKNGKVYPETTYDFIDKYGKSIGTITIHTSCSQTLYVGQEFFYMKGTAKEIKLTVVSGTLKGEPSIPDDASCPVPPPECDCDERHKDHKKHYDDFDKYYKDNKNKMSKDGYSKFMKDIEDYMDEEGQNMDKSDFKMFMDYHGQFLKDNKNHFSSSDYKHSSDKHDKYSKDYPKHDDGCKCDTPPPPCDCEDKKQHYEKYYVNHKKYFDDNKRKFSFNDYKEYEDEHKKYLDDYGKYMDKAEYKKHIDYFKKFLDDNKKKFSSSDYRKYSDDYKKYSDDYKNHDDSCKCGGDDGKDHHDKDDKQKDSKHKDDKNSKDYQYKYGKDHDD